MTPLYSQYVVPFYLQMMRLNAVGRDVSESALLAAARTIAPDEVLALLRDRNWRPQVMGAWFSVRHAAPDVVDGVLQALRESRGSLTAPPLATAAVVLAGPAAAQALRAYLRVDLDHGLGADRFIAATLEHIGAPVDDADLAGLQVTPADRHALQELLALAHQLRSA